MCPVIKWKLVGIGMLQMFWHLFRLALLFRCVISVFYQILVAGLALGSDHAVDTFPSFVYEVFFFQHFHTVVLITLLVYGTYLYEENPNFRFYVVSSASLSFVLLLFTTIPLCLARANYGKVEEQVESSRGMNPYTAMDYFCPQDDINATTTNANLTMCKEERKHKLELMFKGKEEKICFAIYKKKPPPSANHQSPPSCCDIADDFGVSNIVTKPFNCCNSLGIVPNATKSLVYGEIDSTFLIASEGCLESVAELKTTNEFAISYWGYGYTIVHVLIALVAVVAEICIKRMVSDEARRERRANILRHGRNKPSGNAV